MNLAEIQRRLQNEDSFHDLVDRLQVLTGHREQRTFVARVLAPVLGVSHQVGYWWMSGQRRPSLRTVRTLQLLEMLLLDGELPNQDVPPRLVNRARTNTGEE